MDLAVTTYADMNKLVSPLIAMRRHTTVEERPLMSAHAAKLDGCSGLLTVFAVLLSHFSLFPSRCPTMPCILGLPSYTTSLVLWWCGLRWFRRTEHLNETGHRVEEHQDDGHEEPSQARCKRDKHVIDATKPRAWHIL